MKIHALQTGTVRVHRRQRHGVGRGLVRFARTLLDREWTEELPILAWAVEHPEGLLVVDTGETSRASESGYFPRWHPYFRLAVKEQVRREDEIDVRLREKGLDPADVRWLVLTHLHTDHAGGLHHFPRARILVDERELAVAGGLVGQLRGYLPHRWPGWFHPDPVRFGDGPLRPFERSHVLTDAGDVVLVPTPGHTAGHLSVLVRAGGVSVLFAGDATYTQANLLAGVVDGVASLGGGEGAAARTLARIRALASREPLVYLPSHDPGAVARLEKSMAVPVEA